MQITPGNVGIDTSRYVLVNGRVTILVPSHAPVSTTAMARDKGNTMDRPRTPN
jgi:hypothetical protein